MSEFWRSPKVVAIALTAALGTSACGGTRTVTVTETVATAEPPREQPFKRPPSIEQRRFMTKAECFETWWRDRDGQRQPTESQGKYTIITVDGRCNEPLDSPKVGIYYEPKQEGKAPIVNLNGDKLILQCWTLGESIRDVRGPESASDVWGKVGAVDRQVGFVPEVNVGYIKESQFPRC